MYDYDLPQEEPLKRFDEVFEYRKRKEFSTREVGLTHPDNSGFLRIADSGEIEIFAAPGVGLVINPSTRSISIFADSIKFFSKEDDGLRWNNMSFNPASDTYNEPALIKTNDFSNNPAFFRTNYYLNNLDNLDQSESEDSITIIGDYGLGPGAIPVSQNEEQTTVISAEQEKMIQEYAKTNSDSSVINLRQLMEYGYSFDEAVAKIESEDLNISDDLENFPWITNDLD